MDSQTATDSLPGGQLELKFGLEGNVNRKLSVWGTIGSRHQASAYSQGFVQAGVRYVF